LIIGRSVVVEISIRYCLFCEDHRRAREVFFDTRINRVAEAILYCLRLYRVLDVAGSAHISVVIRHGGLKGRSLSAANPHRVFREGRQESEVDEGESEISGSLDEIEANLATMVKEIVAPLLVLFDFAELDDQVYEHIVSNFVSGRIV
jgi:hypothetical protein